MIPSPAMMGTLRPLRLVARTSIAITTVVLVFVSTINAFLGHSDIAILYALAAPLGLASWGFARTGNDEAAIVLLCCVLVVVITMTLFLSSMGVHDHAIIGYSGVLLLSALTLSRRAFIGIACLAMGAGIFAFAIEFAGLTHSRLDRLIGWLALIDFVVITGTIGVIGRYVAEVLFGSLGDARRDASVDPATGLVNRGRFLQLAGLQLREGGPGPGVDALVVADLVSFRRVNQLVGHGAGDRILSEVGRRLAAIDATLLAGRVGDDEFAVLAPGLADEDAAKVLADRVRAALEFEFAGVSVRAAVGLGCRPRRSGGIDALLMAADEALGRAAPTPP